MESQNHIWSILANGTNKNNKQLANGVTNRHDYKIDCLCDIADIVVMRCTLVIYEFSYLDNH